MNLLYAVITYLLKVCHDFLGNSEFIMKYTSCVDDVKKQGFKYCLLWADQIIAPPCKIFVHNMVFGSTSMYNRLVLAITRSFLFYCLAEDGLPTREHAT